MTGRADDIAARFGERTVDTLHDFLAFAEQSARLVQRGRDEFDRDEFMRLAGEALIHRIGEAVARLPAGFTDDHPQVSWRAIRGMRNVVSHRYDAVDHALIWTTLSTQLPQDARRVRDILGSESP